MLKTNGTELIDESADVCLHFSGHVTSPAFGRVLSFVGIRSAHTSFSPFTLRNTAPRESQNYALIKLDKTNKTGKISEIN